MLNYILINSTYNWNDTSLQEFIDSNQLPSKWSKFFDKQQVRDQLLRISLNLQYSSIIYPDLNKVFRAFYMTSLKNTKVVLLGQDCYHNGNATGLCFDVKSGTTINPSLKNIYKQLKIEGFNPTEDGNLSHLPGQGVLMINASLSVEKGKPDSHSKLWYNFTVELVKYISQNKKQVVWLLMGNRAQEFDKYIDMPDKYIIKTSHPSPFSAMRSSKDIPSFIGSGCFTKINSLIEGTIKW